MSVIAIRQGITAAFDELPILDTMEEDLEGHVSALTVALEGSTNAQALKAKTSAFQAMSGVARASIAQQVARQAADDYAHFV